MSKEEIEKAKGWLSALDVKSEFEAISKEIILQYIQELEVSNKELDKENDRLEKIEFERDKANKIIDKMAEQLSGLSILDIKKAKYVTLGDKEEVKQYFEKKVEGR